MPAPSPVLAQELEAVLDDRVGLLTLQMDHEADAAGGALVLRVIEALGPGSAESAAGRRMLCTLVAVIVHGRTLETVPVLTGISRTRSPH
jgi:hypothetical protein